MIVDVIRVLLVCSMIIVLLFMIIPRRVAQTAAALPDRTLRFVSMTQLTRFLEPADSLHLFRVTYMDSDITI